MAAPWCTQVLADLGADVIKLERPGVGDDTRAWGPPFLKAADGSETRDAGYFLCVNRGKRSVTVDVSKPDGTGRWCGGWPSTCDVAIENYKVGALARYGLDAASLRALNPAPGLLFRSPASDRTGRGRTRPRTISRSRRWAA